MGSTAHKDTNNQDDSYAHVQSNIRHVTFEVFNLGLPGPVPKTGLPIMVY